MKLVIQRVASASVEVDDEVISRIGPGLLLLLGIKKGDTMEQATKLARKVVKLKLWPAKDDPDKPWASSVIDNNYEVLVVSQFTLFATFTRPKPNYIRAMGGEEAETLYEAFLELMRKELSAQRVAAGSFGAMMTVELRNDGPVTVELTAEPPAVAANGAAVSGVSSAARGTMAHGQGRVASRALAGESFHPCSALLRAQRCGQPGRGRVPSQCAATRPRAGTHHLPGAIRRVCAVALCLRFGMSTVGKLEPARGRVSLEGWAARTPLLAFRPRVLGLR